MIRSPKDWVMSPFTSSLLEKQLRMWVPCLVDLRSILYYLFLGRSLWCYSGHYVLWGIYHLTQVTEVTWHHWLDGRESEWTPGVGDGQGGLARCDSWGRKESDTTERLKWTELNPNQQLICIRVRVRKGTVCRNHKVIHRIFYGWWIYYFDDFTSLYICQNT